MNQEVAQASKKCPRCEKTYIGYPAISRVDNITEICPDCGVQEAIFTVKTQGRFDKRSRARG